MGKTNDSLSTTFALLNEIGIINQLNTAQFESLLPAGLTQPQFSVLNNFVRLGGERTPAQLASAFQVTRGAMTNTLQRLQTSGLVDIRPSSSDGRSKVVRITAKGRQMRERAIAATRPELAAIVEAFGENEIAQMHQSLQRLREYLDANR